MANEDSDYNEAREMNIKARQAAEKEIVETKAKEEHERIRESDRAYEELKEEARKHPKRVVLSKEEQLAQIKDATAAATKRLETEKELTEAKTKRYTAEAKEKVGVPLEQLKAKAAPITAAVKGVSEAVGGTGKVIEDVKKVYGGYKSWKDERDTKRRKEQERREAAEMTRLERQLKSVKIQATTALARQRGVSSEITREKGTLALEKQRYAFEQERGEGSPLSLGPTENGLTAPKPQQGGLISSPMGGGLMGGGSPGGFGGRIFVSPPTQQAQGQEGQPPQDEFAKLSIQRSPMLEQRETGYDSFASRQQQEDPFAKLAARTQESGFGSLVRKDTEGGFGSLANKGEGGIEHLISKGGQREQGGGFEGLMGRGSGLGGLASQGSGLDKFTNKGSPGMMAPQSGPLPKGKFENSFGEGWKRLMRR